VEGAVFDLWQRSTLSAEEVAAFRRESQAELASARQAQSKDLRAAEAQVRKLTKSKQRLVDAYLAEALTVEDFQLKQQELQAQLLAAQTRLDALGADYERADAHMAVALSLLEQAGALYAACPEQGGNCSTRPSTSGSCWTVMA
jgi:gamma-glutamylcysteine synthetase